MPACSTSLSDYNGHRLPLQAVSYLLDDDYQPVFSSPDRFVQRWNLAENQNHVSREAIDLVLKQYERRRWMFIQQKALKFLNDLNAEIEPGWTDFGQTNHLLGRIALREYVFFHVLHNTEPLTNWQLGDRIIEIAVHLPGYQEYCQHQRDIDFRAYEWADAVVRNPRYYPYGGNAIAAKKEEPTSPSVNQQRALEARQRIEKAVEELESVGQFPEGIRNRIFALKSKGIGVDALYKNKDLWHGEKQLKPAPAGVILAIGEEKAEPRSLKPAPAGVILAIAPISFICSSGSAPLGGQIRTSILRSQGGLGGIPQPPQLLRGLSMLEPP